MYWLQEVYGSMPLKHLQRIADGRIRILPEIINLNLSWVWKADVERDRDLACAATSRCAWARAKFLDTIFEPLGGKGLISIALKTFDETVESSDISLCNQCRKFGRQSFDNGRQKIWLRLGSIFCGEEWDDLEDTSSGDSTASESDDIVYNEEST